MTEDKMKAAFQRFREEKDLILKEWDSFIQERLDRIKEIDAEIKAECDRMPKWNLRDNYLEKK